jgi:hypothetical protein
MDQVYEDQSRETAAAISDLLPPFHGSIYVNTLSPTADAVGYVLAPLRG